MKTNILTVACSLFFAGAFSQNISINTTGNTADASAMLDVSATNKGILIPRVTLQSISDGTTITLPATSLLVYSLGGVLPDGYYYNSGTSVAPNWAVFFTSASSGSNCFTNWQLFTANGTFTVPAGVTIIKVEVWGGGGGGAGGGSAGAGGGGGGYAEGIYTVTPLANYAVTIGALGAKGAAASNGSAGGTTSFGALISATGGNGGLTGSSVPTSGGIGSGGYYNISLGDGGGINTLQQGVVGINGGGGGGASGNRCGGSFTQAGGGGGGLGGGNGGNCGQTGGDAVANSGAGGGGASGAVAGGNGAAGRVIVFW